MDIDKIAMVDAKEIFAKNPRGYENWYFCYEKAMMLGNTPISKKFALFHLPQEEDAYIRLEKDFYDGCPDLLDDLRAARKDGVSFILFFV